MKTPVCSRCKRPLSDPYSIAVGMGPECRGGAAKSGVKFPKARWRVSRGRVVFDGLEKAGPLTVNTEGGRQKAERAADEKREIVLRVKRGGRKPNEAVGLLMDYMREKDSPMPRSWCEEFVQKVWKEEA